jgi:spore germination protein GerM
MKLCQQPKSGCFVLKVISVFLFACGLSFLFKAGHAKPPNTHREEAQARKNISASSKKTPVHLYFSGRSNYFLTSEQRAVIHPEGTVVLARTIVEALIKGPQEGLTPTIPSGTKLNAVYVGPDGLCYVDLSAEISLNHPGGSNAELLSIYSIVNSLILNVTEIKSVKILIDGSEALTLAGHINLQFPIKANMLLIR